MIPPLDGASPSIPSSSSTADSSAALPLSAGPSAHAAIDRDELAAWLRLLETKSLGREAIRKLLAIFGSPGAVLEASPSALRDIGQPALVAALTHRDADTDAIVDKRVEATLTWLSASGDAGHAPRHVIVVGDPHYPQSLLESADPPLLLYAQGRLELLHLDAVAVVGSRNPTAQGLANARSFAAHLSRAGIVVVSGLALGIDGAAHEGALEGFAEGGAGTIAVVGTGLDRVYPRRHLNLAHRISRSGLMLSEYALGTPPLAAYFPQRNRIIAGLAQGTLVVEAALASGSLITARLALESGREVFAIPGSIHSPQSRGCNALIKQGARLVDRAEDLFEELPLVRRVNQRTTEESTTMTRDNHTDTARSRPRLRTSASETVSPVSQGDNVSTRQDETGTVDPVLDALGFDPMSLDELVARTGMSAPLLNGRLLDLELAGRVARMPGQLFQRLVLV